MQRIAGAMAMVLTGCASEPEGYPLSVGEAYQRLAASEMPELRFGRQCGILIHIKPFATAPGRSITWTVTSSGRELIRFSVALEPVDAAHSRVAVTIEPDAQGREPYDGSEFYPHPAFNQPLLPAIEEQVSALLEGRPYDVERVPRGTDGVCNVQRAGLEAGHRFSINDEPGTDSAGTAALRRTHNAGRGWGSPAADWGRR